MANKKISDLAAATTPLTDSDLLETEQPAEAVGTRSRKLTLAQAITWILSKTHAMTAAINEAMAPSIASAATMNIGALVGNVAHVTGTTTVTAFDAVQAGTSRKLIFDGALMLTHNAVSLILPTAANITTVAGDAATFVSEGAGNWRCVNYQRADGTALAGSGGGGAWFVQFAPCDNEPPASNYATLDTRNSRPVLDFDTTTQEGAVFSGVLPNDYAGGGVTIDIFCALTSATTGTVGWDVAFERTQASTDDIDSDSFATTQTVTAVTVPGTSGHVLKMSVNVSDGANMDSLAAGELFRLRVRRDVANDTAAGDAELLAVTIRGQ